MKPTRDQAKALLRSFKAPDFTSSMFVQAGLPVVALVDRLARPDGARWFEALLDGPLFAPFGAGGAALRGSEPIELSRLEALKEGGKRRFRGAGDGGRDAQFEGLLAYCFAVAGALRHHGRMIGSRSREQFDAILIELATAVPEPWSSFLSQAAFVGRG